MIIGGEVAKHKKTVVRRRSKKAGDKGATPKGVKKRPAFREKKVARIKREVVLVEAGKAMDHVLKVMEQYSRGADEIVVKGRGEAISLAVDVAEIVTKRFVKDLMVKTINTGTEIFQGEGGPKEVSTLEILLRRTSPPVVKARRTKQHPSEVLTEQAPLIPHAVPQIEPEPSPIEAVKKSARGILDSKTILALNKDEWIRFGHRPFECPSWTEVESCIATFNDLPSTCKRCYKVSVHDFANKKNVVGLIEAINDYVNLYRLGTLRTPVGGEIGRDAVALYFSGEEQARWFQSAFSDGFWLFSGLKARGITATVDLEHCCGHVRQKYSGFFAAPRAPLQVEPRPPLARVTEGLAVKKLDPEAVLSLRDGECIPFGKWSPEWPAKAVLSEFWDGGDNVRRLVEMINYYLDLFGQEKFAGSAKKFLPIGGKIEKNTAVFYFENNKQSRRFSGLVSGTWHGIKGHRHFGVSIKISAWGKWNRLQKKFGGLGVRERNETRDLNWLPDYYYTLRVPQTASTEEIEGSFVIGIRALISSAEGGVKDMLKIAEDKEYIKKTCNEKAQRRIAKLRNAYLTLSDEKKRAAYDEKLKKIREIFLGEVKSDSFRALSLGGTEPGGSISFFVKVGGHHVIFDAGFNQRHGIIPPFEILKDLPNVEAVFLSHAHADHIGTLPLLLRYIPKDVPVFATVETLKTSKKTMLDSLRQTEKEKGESIFSEAELKNALDRIKLAEYGKTYEHNGVRFVAGNAGHVPGSAMFLVEANGDSVMYTGDFNVERTRTEVPAKPFGKKPDLMICEATYAGVQERKERGEREAELVRAIYETVERGGRALVPCYAIGRTREVMSIIDAAIERKDLQNIPVYAVGLGAALEDVWKWKHVEKLEGDWYKFWKTKKSRCVIIAGSGTLDKGMSTQFLPDVASNKKDSVIGVGYSPLGSTMNLLKRAKNGEKVVLDRDFKPKCEIYEIKLSAHAGGEEIVEFILNQAPKNLIVVHTENPDGIIESERLRDMRPLAPWQFHVVKKGNSYGISLKPKPWEVGGKPVACECGKVFDNIRIASWHAEREGHRLKGSKRIVFFRYEVLEEGRPIDPRDVTKEVYSNLGEYAKKVTAFCVFSQGAKAPNLRRPSGDEMERAMRAVGSADKREPARSRMLQAAMKNPVAKKEFEDLVADIKKAVGVQHIFARGQSFEIHGDVHPGFLEHLEKRMDMIGRNRVRVKITGEKEPHMEVASPANLPMFMLTEIDQVQKLLGCEIEAPRYRYRVLEPGMLGVYWPNASLLLVSSDLKGNAEHLAVTLDHELAHHAQYIKNKRLREARESGVEPEGKLEFVEGFAQWVTGKLKNSMWLVEVPERGEAKYFEGARLFGDIEAAFGEEKAIEVGLHEDQNGFLKVAEEAKKTLALGRAGALKSGFDVLKASGVLKRDLLLRERIPPRERENMLTLIQEKAADTHETRYVGWSPNVVARDAALQIVAEEAVRRAGGGDTFKAKKALEYKLMKGRGELLEKMANVIQKLLPFIQVRHGELLEKMVNAYVSALERAMKVEEVEKKEKAEGVKVEAEKAKQKPAVRKVPRRKEPLKREKYCGGCGAKMSSGANFCPMCGEKQRGG